MNSFELIPGKGVGIFIFGTDRQAIENKVGKPDEIEYNDEEVEGEGKIEVWHYDEYELSVEFLEANDYRLSTIAINSDNCELKGVKLIGKNYSEITSLIDTLNLGEYDTEKIDLEDKHDITLLSVIEPGLNFWFENDILTEIQLIQTE